MRSVHACLTFLLECFALDHACCLPHSAKQNGLREVTFLFRRGSGSPVVRSRVDVRLSDLAGLLRVCAFSGGDPDGVRKRRGNAGDEERSRRRGVGAFLCNHIGFVMFSAGSTLGAARPQTCAKESLTPWTLFIWVVMWVRFTRRRALGYNEDPPESNKWRPHCGCSGGSCGHTNAPVYASP